MAEQLNLASEMVASCSARLGKDGYETAVKGIRAVCRYYGGQMIFLTKIQTQRFKNGRTAFRYSRR